MYYSYVHQLGCVLVCTAVSWSTQLHTAQEYHVPGHSLSLVLRFTEYGSHRDCIQRHLHTNGYAGLSWSVPDVRLLYRVGLHSHVPAGVHSKRTRAVWHEKTVWTARLHCIVKSMRTFVYVRSPQYSELTLWSDDLPILDIPISRRSAVGSRKFQCTLHCRVHQCGPNLSTSDHIAAFIPEVRDSAACGAWSWHTIRGHCVPTLHEIGRAHV